MRNTSTHVNDFTGFSKTISLNEVLVFIVVLHIFGMFTLLCKLCKHSYLGVAEQLCINKYSQVIQALLLKRCGQGHLYKCHIRNLPLIEALLDAGTKNTCDYFIEIRCDYNCGALCSCRICDYSIDDRIVIRICYVVVKDKYFGIISDAVCLILSIYIASGEEKLSVKLISILNLIVRLIAITTESYVDIGVICLLVDIRNESGYSLISVSGDVRNLVYVLWSLDLMQSGLIMKLFNQSIATVIYIIEQVCLTQMSHSRIILCS